MSQIKKDRTRKEALLIRGRKCHQKTKSKMSDKGVVFGNTLFIAASVSMFVGMIYGLMMIAEERNLPEALSGIVPFLVVPFVAVTILPLTAYLFYFFASWRDDIRYHKKFEDEINHTAWAREIDMDKIVGRFFGEENFGHGEEVNRFKLIFSDMLKRHFADSDDLLSAVRDLKDLRARRQWLQLEADRRFVYHDRDGVWKVCGSILDNGILTAEEKEGIVDLLRRSTTHYTRKNGEYVNTKLVFTTDHPEEAAALVDLAQAVNDSEHYDFQDFLELATAPEKLVGSSYNTNRPHAIWIVDGIECSDIRTSHLKASTTKVHGTSVQGFALNTDVIIELANSEIGNRCLEVAA